MKQNLEFKSICSLFRKSEETCVVCGWREELRGMHTGGGIFYSHQFNNTRQDH